MSDGNEMHGQVLGVGMDRWRDTRLVGREGVDVACLPFLTDAGLRWKVALLLPGTTTLRLEFCERKV